MNKCIQMFKKTNQFDQAHIPLLLVYEFHVHEANVGIRKSKASVSLKTEHSLFFPISKC